MKRATVAGGFACPMCRGSLMHGDETLRCPGCAHAFAIEEGIPALLPQDDEGRNVGQATYFDHAVDAEFEIERPRGEPALYGWLLSEKFRRAVEGLPLHGRSALVVCGGSGMDAEFLASAGAVVISSDISIGAARRTTERARRHGFAVTPIVADVERLPFADRSIDVVYVHDGLHHIEDPHSGLREMARVAGRAVSLTEPADAAATALAVRVGLALEREDAGNRVARLRLADIRTTLESEGFRIKRACRYGMLYRHEPGPAMRILSRPPLFAAAKAGFRTGNLLLGGWGNKLSVLAVRV